VIDKQSSRPHSRARRMKSSSRLTVCEHIINATVMPEVRVERKRPDDASEEHAVRDEFARASRTSSTTRISRKPNYFWPQNNEYFESRLCTVEIVEQEAVRGQTKKAREEGAGERGMNKVKCSLNEGCEWQIPGRKR
jgi:hypothetical protein